MSTSKNYWLFLLFLSCTFTSLLAEGTKELAPTSSDRIYLYTNTTSYNDFGRYDGADDQRLYIHIEDSANEQVYLGFSQPVSSGHYPCNNSTQIIGYFRIKDPTGRVVYPIKDSPNGQILDATTSNITSYSQAVAGPAPIVGASGYTPFVFDPTGLPTGDYYIEFSRVINSVSINNSLPIEWFDITVASKGVNPQAHDGRIYSRNWALFTPSIACGADPDYSWFDRAFNGDFFVYTEDDIVTEVNFLNAGFQPGAFNAVFNDAGTARNDDVIHDRKSLEGVFASSAQHRIFLNDPDISLYPTGALGNFSSNPKFITCENGTACIELSLTEPGQIELLIDLDRASGDFIYDLNSRDVEVAIQIHPEPGELPPYIRCVPWDGRDGFGNKVGGEVDVRNTDIMVRYTQGIYHFPIYDAEYMLHGFEVTTIRPIPDNGSPKRFYFDDTNIPDTYVIGGSQPHDDSFNGCSTPCHTWSNKDFGDVNTINTWFFAREEYVIPVEFEGCPISALDDSTRMAVNTRKAIDILDNDLGTDQIDLSSISVDNPLNGVVSFDSGTLLANYSSNNGFVGVDSFTYAFCYNVLPVRSLCDSAKVFIVVEPGVEICNNTFDDDGDGLVDCDDPECQSNVPAVIQRKNEENLWWVVLLISCLFIKTDFRRLAIFQSKEKLPLEKP